MGTKELPININVEQDDFSQSTSKSFDQTGDPSGFLFDVSLSTAIAAKGKFEAQAPTPEGPLSPEMLEKMIRCWRPANYLCIGQIYLFDKPPVCMRKMAQSLSQFLKKHRSSLASRRQNDGKQAQPGRQ
jgi:hypothetical protein